MEVSCQTLCRAQPFASGVLPQMRGHARRFGAQPLLGCISSCVICMSIQELTIQNREENQQILGFSELQTRLWTSEVMNGGPMERPHPLPTAAGAVGRSARCATSDFRGPEEAQSNHPIRILQVGMRGTNRAKKENGQNSLDELIYPLYLCHSFHS